MMNGIHNLFCRGGGGLCFTFFLQNKRNAHKLDTLADFSLNQYVNVGNVKNRKCLLDKRKLRNLMFTLILREEI